MKLAKETKRSETFYIEEALQHYLNEYAEAQLAKDRFSDPKSKVISSKAMRARLRV